MKEKKICTIHVPFSYPGTNKANFYWTKNSKKKKRRIKEEKEEIRSRKLKEIRKRGLLNFRMMMKMMIILSNLLNENQ